jgi:hypothetical protein
VCFVADCYSRVCGHLHVSQSPVSQHSSNNVAVIVPIVKLYLQCCSTYFKFHMVYLNCHCSLMHKLQCLQFFRNWKMSDKNYVCVCVCSDVLYERIYENISGDDMARRVFLECLERYLLAGRLTTMRPAIAQDFVSHFEQQGLLSTLEACLCVLDISCLDLHQVAMVTVSFC